MPSCWNKHFPLKSFPILNIIEAVLWNLLIFYVYWNNNESYLFLKNITYLKISPFNTLYLRAKYMIFFVTTCLLRKFFSQTHYHQVDIHQHTSRTRFLNRQIDTTFFTRIFCFIITKNSAIKVKENLFKKRVVILTRM